MKLSRRDARSFIILGAIIVVLSGYLVLRSGDRVRYELPETPEFQVSQVDSIQVEQAGDQVTVVRRGRDWLIQPQDYPADGNAVENMIAELAALKITELVSAAEESYPRYGVDAPGAAIVRALEDGKVLRELVVGRRAATYAHTYVRVAGDPRVFHAEGDLRAILVRGRDELRDRVVLRFPRGSVTDIEYRGAAGEVSAKKEERGDSQVWVTADGQELETETVEQALDRLALLRTTRYSETPHAGVSVLAEITIQAGETHRVTLYDEEDDLYPADSSDSDYPFYINSVVVDQLLAPFSP